MNKIENLRKLAKLIRYWILLSTTEAGSGHPTSCLSAVELMTALLFGGKFRFDLKNINLPNNDRLIFSKGHSAPLLYSLWAAAGALNENDLLTLRKFESQLEGHPTPRFLFAEAATGALGQGLSIGLGIALNAKYLDKLPYFTYVLLGDSEMSEGALWEAIQLASFYKLDNLVGVLDVNRLGQRGETMLGHKIQEYQKRISAFGWQTYLIRDGHNFKEILAVLNKIGKVKGKPTMIIAKTIKGKGISFLENKDGWHGKALSKEDFEKAKKELGEIDLKIRGKIKKPKNLKPKPLSLKPKRILENLPKYSLGEKMATRKAYGIALTKLGSINPKVVALDAEVKNSTFSEIFEEYFPERYFEMFIAEQNMVGTALGLATRGKIPFVSTFSAFLSRAYDQIRMAQYSREKANIKFVGSHAGVSIGQDGPSQSGLEDIAFFRTLRGSCVLYPSDAVSTEKLVFEMAKYPGISYLRTTRPETPIIYSAKEEFKIGGSKVLKESERDSITLVGAGITLHEALKAYEELKKEGILVRVIDCYSVKPLDTETLKKAAKETGKILVVEDHYPEGGIGEAVRSELTELKIPVYSLAVNKIPVSGKPEELLNFEEISAVAIIKKVKEILAS
jgi:transketolase